MAFICYSKPAYGQMSQEDKSWMQIETFSGSNEKKIILLNSYIKQYPNSERKRLAITYRDELKNIYADAIYEKALTTNDPQIIRDAITKYPNQKKARIARQRLNLLDQKAWSKTDKNDSLSLRNYVSNFPGGIHKKEAMAGMIRFDPQINIPETAKAENNTDLQKMGVKTLQKFIVQNSGSPLVVEAQKILVQKELFYYKIAISNKNNIVNYRNSVNKFQELFPKSKRLNELQNDLKAQQVIYDSNKNNPAFVAWTKLNKDDLDELRKYNEKFPDSEFKEKLRVLERKQEEILYNKALKRNSLAEIDLYLKAFPNGKYSAKLTKDKKILQEDKKYDEVKKLIAEGNKYKLSEFIKNNKTNPLKNTIANTIEKKSDLYYLINLTNTGMVIQIMNYDRPSITVFDPNQDITIDSTQLKAKGVIVANFDIYNSEAYLIIKDSNNRERKIKIDRTIRASMKQLKDLIALIIEGGIPPYVLEFKNIDVGYIERSYEEINTNSKNEYIISTDSLSDLSGQYDLLVKNNDNGQAVVLSGLVFENSNNRTIYFSILAVGVLFLTIGVIRLYIRRSNKKTIFDEYE